MCDASSADDFSPVSLDAPEQIARLLDELSSSSQDPWCLLQKLGRVRGVSQEFEVSEIILHVERALAYTFVEDDSHVGAVAIGRRFSSSNGWPPNFSAVPDSEKQSWAAVAACCSQPLPRAHLLDVALSAGVGRSRDTAKMAADLYLSLFSEGQVNLRYRVGCLRRAWSLARSFGLQDLEMHAREAAFLMTQSAINQGPANVQILLQLFKNLTVQPKDNDFKHPTKKEVQEILKLFRTQTSCWGELAQIIADLLCRVAENNVERSEAQRVLVEGYLTAAESATGMRASLMNEKAADIARRYGMKDLYNRAVRALQDKPMENRDFHSIAVEIVIPKYLVEGRMAIYRRSRNIYDALEIWSSTPSPTGNYASNMESATRVAKSSVRSLMSRTIYAENGLPLRTTHGDENAIFEELEFHELMAVSMYGEQLAQELQAIKAEHGETTPRDVAAHLLWRYSCDSELATAFAEALQSFWEGRFGDAARAAYPLIEAGMRGLLLLLGKPLYRLQTGKTDGRFPSMESYIQMLKSVDFDIDWLRCIQNPVSTWRNALAHGHRHAMKSREAAVLLRVAALFTVLTPDNSTMRDRMEIEERLRDPVGWAAQTAKLTPKWELVYTLTWMSEESCAE